LLFIYSIQYQLAVDKFAHQPCQAPQFELQDFFGQVLHFLVVNISPSLDYGIYQATGPIVTIDLNQVQCVIGQIFDQGKWAIVDRSTSVAEIHIL
jgi:hypothetical protein